MRRSAWLWSAALALAACSDDGNGGSGTTSDDPGTGSGATATTGAATTSVDTTGSGGAATSGSEDSTTGAVSTCPTKSSTWASHSRDPENSRHVPDETILTSRTVADLTEVWSLSPLDGATSTPVVRDGVVYIADWSGDAHARCLADGSEIWTTDVSTDANASLLVTDDMVYVPDGNGFLHGLQRDTGEIVWSVELDAHPQANLYSSPVLAGGMLVIGVASTELATVVDDYVFRGSIVALDPATGDEQWRTYTTTNDANAGAGVSVWSSAAVDESLGLLFIGSGNTYEEPAAPLSDSLLALDIMTGEIVWNTQFTTGDVYTVFGGEGGPDSDVGASPNLFEIDGQAVVGVGDKAGNYMVLDRETGEQVWMQSLAPGSPLGGVMTTAAVGEGTIFVATNTWNELFSFGDPTNTATLFALQASNGAVQWQVEVDQPVFGAITLAADVVYHGDTSGRVYARSALDGSELWSAEPGGDIGGGFSVVDGKLLVTHGFWFFTAPAKPNGGLVAYGLPQ